MTPAALESTSWPDGLIQLLDDHHVAVLCDDGHGRRRAARILQQHLSGLADTRVIDIDCSAATDLPSFCKQLEPHFPDRPITPSPWWRDINNVIDLLRSAGAGSRAGGSFHEIMETPRGPRAGDSHANSNADENAAGMTSTPPRRSTMTLKREYFLWHEAEALLETDVELFGALVNAFIGVAAEREHVSVDRLLIQRVVFLGGAKLGAYAEDSNGQFCRWLEEDQGSPFWEVISVVERPAVIAYRVEG